MTIVGVLDKTRASGLDNEVRPHLSTPTVGSAFRVTSRPREIVADYLAWQVIVNCGESIVEALDFEAQYKVSFWDGLVIAAAQHSGAAVLYSKDLNEGQNYGSVRVVNPLLDRPHRSESTS